MSPHTKLKRSFRRHPLYRFEFPRGGSWINQAERFFMDMGPCILRIGRLLLRHLQGNAPILSPPFRSAIVGYGILLPVTFDAEAVR